MKTKKDAMVPGKKYRGWGFVNEYNEFTFEPEETGTRQGVIKQITVKDGVSLSETKDHLLIRLKVRKDTNKALVVNNVLKKVNELSKLIFQYDI